jgi:hypothetical protein
VGPRAGLDTEDGGKILCPYRGSNPGRPVVQFSFSSLLKAVFKVHSFYWANVQRHRTLYVTQSRKTY